MISKRSLYASAIVLVVVGALGAAASARDFHILPAKTPLDTSAVPVTTTGGCDQSATTTPCSEIAAMAAKNTQETSVAAPQPAQKTYGPLVNTYADAKYGFSLKYPNGLHIEHGGDTILNDETNSKLFALKICSPDSPCGSFYAHVQSLEELSNDIEAVYGESVKYGRMTSRQAIVDSSLFKTAQGIPVLKRTYEYHVYSDKGEDITASVCEMCNGAATEYVFFRNTGHYMILWPIAGDKTLVEKIVDSVVF